MCLQQAFVSLGMVSDGATSVAQTSGGGRTSSDMPWRDKDEVYLHRAYRAMRYAHTKHYPGNKLKKSKSY